MLKMKTLIIISILLLSFPIFSQSGQKITVDSLFSTVAFLEEVKKDSIKYGTGFFITNGASTYLVTAEHVAKFLTLSSNIVIKGINDSPINYKLKEISWRKDSLFWN